MTSPFPGMDPYLEISGDWRDFHAAFIALCCGTLNDQLPENSVARIDERFTLLELPSGRDRGGYPDVSVLRSGPSPHRAGGARGWRRSNRSHSGS
jgi:hypothetical protein